jgi:hypothetical protein
MQAMGEQINKIVDVTIHYPAGRPTFMDFVSGKVPQVDIQVEVMDVNEQWCGDYSGDNEFRVRFQAELNRVWQNKDETMLQLQTQSALSNKR